MPYKPFHPDIIGWKAFIPRQEGTTAPVYFSFPIQAKHLTDAHTDYDYQTAASCLYVL